MAKKKAPKPLTTAQRLGSLVKSGRDIMRKDKGLNVDLDRLPMLTCVMFLKFLDDQEKIEEERAKLKKQKFRPVIKSPYRWRDWAAQEGGNSGDALIKFVDHQEAVRPDGAKGPGLIAYLRSLQGSNGDDRRDIVASVFSGVNNRMERGYLLRDATWDSGEFYAPRSVVRLMVELMAPQLGETVLPKCLAALISSPWFWKQLAKLTRGEGARRERIRPEMFLEIEINMPPHDDQRKALEMYRLLNQTEALRESIPSELEAILPSVLNEYFNGGCDV